MKRSLAGEDWMQQLDLMRKEMAMSSEAETQEMFVLRALETGLDLAEAALVQVKHDPDCWRTAEETARLVKLAEAERDLLAHAIRLVQGWLSQHD